MREQGNQSEAIHQFKQGCTPSRGPRAAEPVLRDRHHLRAIGDVGEALYYFEMIVKRDPGFADAAARVDYLRSQGGQPAHDALDDI